MLSVHHTGGPSSPHTAGTGQDADPVVLVHGFTQTGHMWVPITAALARTHRVLALDAPGHGRSSEILADLPKGAEMMTEAAAHARAPRAAWVGYSMGGRYALHVALQYPEAVERLVLVSTTAGIDDPRQRSERRARDEELADRIEKEGVAPFIDWWLQLPMFQTLPREAAAPDDRLTNTASGLAASLRLAGTGTQEPLWERLSDLRMPVLVVAGALDSIYLAHARRLVDAIGPNAALVVLEDAGHACHLERPAAFTDLLTTFVTRAGH